MTEVWVERRLTSVGARRPPVLTHALAGMGHGGGGGAGVEGRVGPVDPVGSPRAWHVRGGEAEWGPHTGNANMARDTNSIVSLKYDEFKYRRTNEAHAVVGWVDRKSGRGETVFPVDAGYPS